MLYDRWSKRVFIDNVLMLIWKTLTNLHILLRVLNINGNDTTTIYALDVVDTYNTKGLNFLAFVLLV